MEKKTLFVKITDLAGRTLYSGTVISWQKYGDVNYVELKDERRGYVYVKQDIDRLQDATFTFFN